MPLFLAATLAISTAAYPQQKLCSEETVLVEVYGPKGLPALGLQPGNFRARAHREPLRILKVTPWSGPARVILLFDLSGSDIRLTPIEKSVGLDILRQAPEGMSLAMVVFASRAEVVAPFSADTATVEDKIKNLDAIAEREPKKDRKTALYDAVNSAVGLFGHSRSGDAVCLISDGWNNASQSTRQQAEQTLLANRIRLFAVVLPEDTILPRDRIPEEDTGAAALGHLAESSGGVRYVLQPSTASELRFSPAAWLQTALHVPPAFDQVMARGYELEVALPRALRKPERWGLEVVDASGKADHQHFVAYPWLSPCEMKP